MRSSKMILSLAVVITVVSLLLLGVTMDKYGITGKATDTGEANLTIQASASISFTTSQINWGTGYVNEAPLNGSLDTEGNNVDVTSFSTVSEGLVLRNDGNVNVTINLTSSQIASAFIGGVAGTGPSFKWKASENETNSCAGGIQTISSYTEVGATSIRVCDDMLYTADNDTILIDLKVVIPEDALGTKGSVITALGTAI